MISHALNSGAINTVPFPSSELGASIMQLLGESEAAATIGTLSLRLSATAKTQPSAIGTAAFKSKILFGAAISASAETPPPTIRVKVPSSGSTSCAATAGKPSPVIVFKMPATASATASASAMAVSRVSRGASVSASATPMLVGLKKVFVNGATVASANTANIAAVKEVPMSAIQASVAKTIGAMFFKRRIAATAQATSATAAGGQTRIFLGAAAIPTAGCVATPSLHVSEMATGSAIANGISGISQKLASPAAVVAQAEGVSGYRIHITMSAITVAEAIGHTAAMDFATEIPAPLERQIVVPQYDRSMKVVV